ncbi:MAG: hypothetical protein JKY71_04615 [Alphaproteobacteria bacterium]|nr:hypothetical protein [Alphaproteobacteria bacterium]
MRRIVDIILFIFANLLGFSSTAISYNFAYLSGLIDTAFPETIGEDVLYNDFFLGTIITWAVCAVFSLGFFFAKGKERYLFLCVPVIVPMIYGFNVLNGLAALS